MKTPSNAVSTNTFGAPCPRLQTEKGFPRPGQKIPHAVPYGLEWATRYVVVWSSLGSETHIGRSCRLDSNQSRPRRIGLRAQMLQSQRRVELFPIHSLLTEDHELHHNILCT